MTPESPTSSAPPWIIFARQFLGSGNPTGYRGPFCKAFTNFALRHAGMHPGPSLMAIEALRDGVGVASPQIGDLAVMRGHVTFFMGWAGGGWFVGLGGNQGHGRVTESRFSMRAVVRFVRPT